MFDYDLIVIGGGSAGLVAVGEARRLGFKPLLVEKEKVGGECLHTGCVPSKALIRSAKVADLGRRSAEYGLPPQSHAPVDLEKVMDRIRKIIAEIGEKERESLRRERIEIVVGSPEFLDSNTVLLNGEKVTGRIFLICTGSKPIIPEIDGLKDAGFLTHQNLFDLDTLPQNLLVIGGGPVGVEMAQAFQRLGSYVTIFQKGKQLLPKEDEEMAALLSDILSEEGLQIFTEAAVQKIERSNGKLSVSFEYRDKIWTMEGDRIFAAIGKIPNLDGLNLEKIGVQVSRNGIAVDEHFRSSVKNIYACGDVTGLYPHTHMAGYQAKIAVYHALAGLPVKADFRVFPWATFADPELARVGMTESEARKAKSGGIVVYRFPFSDVDRAVIDGEARGMIKVIVDTGGRILGAHILGPGAGELIHEFVLAMKHEMSLKEIGETIHIYPTLSLGNWQASEIAFAESVEKSAVVKLFRRFAPKPGHV